MTSTHNFDSRGGNERNEKSYQFIEHTCDFITINRELPRLQLSLSMFVEAFGNEPSAHARELASKACNTSTFIGIGTTQSGDKKKRIKIN